MNMKIATAIMALFLSAGSCAEPYALKGDRLGMTLDQFKKDNYREISESIAPFCSEGRSYDSSALLYVERWHDDAGIVHCRKEFPFEINGDVGKPTVAGIPVDSLLYRFVDKKLYMISVEFSHDNAEVMAEALISKYGKPHKTSKERFQNRLGATFIGSNLSWSREGTMIVFTEYYGSLNDSAIFFLHEKLNQLASSRKPKGDQGDL